jgi:hypothetical protein
MSTSKPTSLPPAHPLLTGGQLFQLRAERPFELLRAANQARQALDVRRDQIHAQFFATLPAGYRLAHYDTPREAKEPYFCLLDDNGNDIAYPVTAIEAHGRAWQHAGGGSPLLKDDPEWSGIQSAIERKHEEQTGISLMITALSVATRQECSAAGWAA